MTRRLPSAVMAHRATPAGPDDFPTPPWATRALLERLPAGLEHQIVWEPAANRGTMVRPLRERFLAVVGSDIADYGLGWPAHDFLSDGIPCPAAAHAHWIITNPPFSQAARFAGRALEAASHGVALLVRSAFLEGSRRHRALFSQTPPSLVLQFCERHVMLAERLLDPDISIWRENGSKAGGEWRKPSTTTAYSWLVWSPLRTSARPLLDWIPPGTRARLTRPGDYEIGVGYTAAPVSRPSGPAGGVKPGTSLLHFPAPCSAPGFLSGDAQ
jgi:hypothetical protein